MFSLLEKAEDKFLDMALLDPNLIQYHYMYLKLKQWCKLI